MTATPVAEVTGAEMAAEAVVLPPPAQTGLPWWLRIGVKLVLARLPVPHAFWRKIGVFRHGCLAEDVRTRGSAFRAHHAAYARFSDRPLRSVVEIGPGDSVGMALWAAAYGAQRVWLIDAGRFAVDDPRHYREVCAEIARHGQSPPALADAPGIDEVLAAANAVYRTDGVAGLAAIPDASVDLLLSHAVLEHIPGAEMADLMRESFRVLRPGGVCSHAVDLQDHLGGALNNLRLPTSVWEHPLVAGSGFYTNRLRCAEICGLAEAAGFRVSMTQSVRWPGLPTPRRRLAPEFRDWPDDELRIAGFTVALQKPGGETGCLRDGVTSGAATRHP